MRGESEFRKAYVYVDGCYAGVLSEEEDGYAFTYGDDYYTHSHKPVSLTLPLSKQHYHSSIFFPFFDGLLPEDKEKLALALNGKRRNITLKDFCILADVCGVEKKTAVRMIQSICQRQPQYETAIAQSLLPEEMRDGLVSLMRARMARLQAADTRS